jgi:tetratricopeptide (TPR) repeat protein
MSGNQNRMTNEPRGDSPRNGLPGQLNDLIQLAARHHATGQFAEAEVAYRKILEIRPGWAEVHNNLGTVLKDQGKLDQAVAEYGRAVTLRPDLAELHNNLGTALKDQGELDQAAAHYEQALALKPDYAEAHNNLGNLLKSRGKLDQAVAHYQQALAFRPNLVEAHNNLGVVLADQGKFDQAAAHYEQALALRPDLAEVHNNFGNALRDQAKLDQAVATYEQALALRPDLVEAHNNLGIVLAELGKYDQAVARYERALALKPDYAEAHNNLGNALKDQGKFDEANARFAHVLAFHPDHAETHYNRADIKTFCPGDADLAALEALAADTRRLPASKMVYIHLALSKAYEDVGDYPRAFEQMVKGNALKRREVVYDEAACRQTFRLIADVFDSGFLARFAGVGDPSSTPIFVLGMPRSGSTLVEQILASHPQVQAAGELANLTFLANGMFDSDGGRIPFPASVRTFGSNDFRRMGEAYLASLPAPAEGKIRITDKMPVNFLYVGLIRSILPNARVIHTLRDPVDTCISCFSRLFTSGLTFSYDLAELGRYYRRYSQLMAHWQAVLPAGTMLDVSYENVVDNLEQEARRMIDYCGLPWDDRCLSFHKTKRPVRTASNVQVRRPVYRSSVGRWRRYETFLLPLLAELDGSDRAE